MLTKEQIELVKTTVPVLREHGVALISHFYKRMLSHNPELMQVFNMGHQRAGFQQQALAWLCSAYAENIENLKPLLGAVLTLPTSTFPSAFAPNIIQSSVSTSSPLLKMYSAKPPHQN